MIHNAKGQLVTRSIMLLALAWAFGWFFDAALLCFILALISLLTFHIFHLLQLVKWLSAPNKTLPPDSFGTWGQIYDHIQMNQITHSKEIGRFKHILKRVQASTEALADAVIIINKDDQLLWWNKAAQSLLNLKRKVDSGQAVTNLIRDPRFNVFLQDSQPENAFFIQTNHNPIKHLQITKATYGDDEQLLLLQDISKIRVLEKTRRDFISNASHELRTPLTVLKGYLETFEDYNEQLPETFIRPLSQMQAQTQRMENLVRDLLALSSLEEQKLDSTIISVDIKKLLEPILIDAKLLAIEKKHDIIFTQISDNLVKCDPALIVSAVSNLIFNAVRYSPAKSKIEVIWDHTGHLIVTDNGIGIQPQHLPRLTERFYRVDDSRSSDSGGTGLGLAIVKHIMFNHQGELNIESKYNEGSSFILVFPKQRLLKKNQAN